MTNITNYSKAIVAVLGAGVTAALGLVSHDSQLFTLLTVLSAMLTAAGVYFVPNTVDAPVVEKAKAPADFSDIQLATPVEPTPNVVSTTNAPLHNNL